jgi:hypothetical protein
LSWGPQNLEARYRRTSRTHVREAPEYYGFICLFQ